MTNLTAPTDLASLVGSWTVDPTHTTVGFAVRHAMVSTVRGSFTDFTGSVVVTDPTTAQVEVTINAASVDTANAQRDEHLRSADFFSAENSPTWAFRSTGIRDIDGTEFVLVGDLTANGVTKQVTLDVEFFGTNTDAFGAERAGFAASGKLKRSDFGITWNAALETGGVLVSDAVTLTIDASLVKA